MGKVIMQDDVQSGKCCAICEVYFEQREGGYGHPVACDGCWDRDCGYPSESGFTPLPGEFEKSTIQKDIDFVKRILPVHYEVKESNKKGSVHCKSEIGLRLSPYRNESTGRMVTDAEDEEQWSYVFKAIKKHFGNRFQEVFHNTYFCHVDFTIYLKSKP